LKLRPDIIERAFDDNVPDGHVVSQDPPGEMKLKAGEGVKLVISKGPRFVTVPSLKGLSERQAKNLLAKSGLSFGGSESTQLDGVAEGVVTAQAPPAETRVEKSTSVQLFVKTPAATVFTSAGTQTFAASTSGTLTFAYTPSAGNGTYSFYAIATDQAGN
ncbi:MAG: PASTA domain-containing protein, partial [Armatimonadetes bacterium]|nr:PASTA domain-containing protein [Armatimonadota bacterium]